MLHKVFLHLLALFTLLSGNVGFCMTLHDMDESMEHGEGVYISGEIHHDCCPDGSPMGDELFSAQKSTERQPEIAMFRSVFKVYKEEPKKVTFSRVSVDPSYHRDKQKFFFTDTVRLLI